jgi:hypothetical protein
VGRYDEPTTALSRISDRVDISVSGDTQHRPSETHDEPPSSAKGHDTMRVLATDIAP